MHRQFSIPGIKTSDRHIKTVASSTAGAIEATPNCACVSMCMGTCEISWIFQWRWQQWTDGKRTLLGTYAFHDRHVASPSLLRAALMYVTFATSPMKLYLTLTGRLLYDLVY